MDIEATPRYIAFDAVEIDLIGRRVTVAGNEAALEPKAFDVLALLAQAPGRAFTRDEILDAVWGHRHVTPGVLNRVITLIRQALGENAEQAQYLRTLHGVGYRFDGEVRQLSRHGGANEAPALADGGTKDPVPDRGRPPGTAVSPDRVLESARGNSPESEPAAISSPAPTTLRFPSPRLHWVLVVGFAALAIGGLLWSARQRETDTAAPSPTLVVLPLNVIGDEKNESAFAGGLSEEITMQLAHVEGLRLISSTSAARAQKDGFDPSQLAERLRTTHALEGSLRQSGEELRIDLRLIETPSGRAIWAQDFDRNASDVFGVQQEIAQAVASALALRMKLGRSMSAPPNADVFREFLELRYVFHSRPASEYPKAEAALEALAARAPDFAPAHALLALNLASHFEPGREQLALPQAMQALRIDPESPYAHAALGELACLRNEWNDCMRELRVALALNPADTIMNLIVGMRLARLGYGENALAQIRIAHAIDPLSYWTNANLGSELDVLDRHEEARLYLDLLQRLDPASSMTHGLRWANAVARSDLPGARDIAVQMPDGEPWKASFVAVAEARADPSSWPDAIKALQAAQEKTGKKHWLLSLVPQPDLAAVLRMYEDNNHFSGKFIWGWQFATIRPDPAFSDFLRRTKTIDYWNANGWPPQCKPDGDGAKCN